MKPPMYSKDNASDQARSLQKVDNYFHIKKYLTANQLALNNYFIQQQKIVKAVIGGLSETKKNEIFSLLIENNKEVLTEHLACQATIVERQSLTTDCQSYKPNASKQKVTTKSTLENTNPKEKQTSKPPLADLLINSLASATGFDAKSIRLDADLESELGVDSITLIETISKALNLRPDLLQLQHDFRQAKSLSDILLMADDAVSNTID